MGLNASGKLKKQDTQSILLFCKQRMLILQLQKQELRKQQPQKQQGLQQQEPRKQQQVLQQQGLRKQELQKQQLQKQELQQLFLRHRRPGPKTTKQQQTGIFSFLVTFKINLNYRNKLVFIDHTTNWGGNSLLNFV